MLARRGDHRRTDLVKAIYRLLDCLYQIVQSAGPCLDTLDQFRLPCAWGHGNFKVGDLAESNPLFYSILAKINLLLTDLRPENMSEQFWKYYLTTSAKQADMLVDICAFANGTNI